MKHFLLSLMLVSVVFVDMYQDRKDPTKTIVIIEKDGVVNTYSVDNDDLEKETLIQDLVKDND